MKKVHVTVPWKEGLHLKPAARLVRLVQRFESHIRFHVRDKIADGRSLLSILLLAAACSVPMIVEAEGLDEVEAITSIQSFFSGSDDEETAVSPESQPD